jgi:sigma-B regulation protein RsbU (phosphoserine phosphatase)
VASSEGNAEQLYEHAPCGFLSAEPGGRLVRVNETFLRWTGYAREDLIGVKRFQDLLTAGGRIYHETHYAPLLRMQGSVREIAVDIVCADGRRLPVLVNSVLLLDAGGAPEIIRTTIFDATERKSYERELLAARDRERAAREEIERLHAETRAVAHTLQQSLLAGEPPQDPRYSVATLYQPAVRDLEVGGDWHDVFRLPGDKLGIVVGDVVGRGLGAATAMGQLRSATRALAGAGLRPEAVIRHLDTFVAQSPASQYATLAYAQVDPTTGEVVLAAAGHLPPVLIGDGEPRLYLGGRTTPLGVTVPALPRTEATFTLAPGTGFVLYTDGLVERRAETIDTGLRRLMDVLAHETRPQGLVDALLTAGGTEDDVCILVFRRS